jgi:MYXO-CTERM domain-containing protein
MLISLITLAIAGAPVDHDHAKDGLSKQDPDVLYQRFVQFFEPDSLAIEERLSPETWHCGTGLVLEIKANWNSFSAPQKGHMAGFISPWVDGVPPAPSQAEPPAAMAPTETCFDANPSRRPSWVGDGDNRILTEHFSVEWDGDSISDSKAEQWAESLEHSWQVEFDEMGWREPIQSSQYLILAYVAAYEYAGAVTSVEYCDGDYSPFIMAGKASFYQSTWYQDMAGHELNHASQFAYGYGHEFYFWESTATWIEEYIYPNHNAWAQYIVGYSQAPHLAINKSSQQDQDIFNHMYGMAILNFYLDEYIGGPEFVESLWDYATSHGNQYDLWIGEILEDKGYDWGEVYDGFIATNAVMAYDEQAYFTAVEREDSVNSFPASGGNSGNDKPEGYGQNYIRIKTRGATDEAPDLKLNFDGADSVEWSVQLVGELDDDVAQVVKVEISEGSGEGVFRDFGDYDRIWLVLSPLTTKEKAYNYTWDLDVFEAEPGPVDTGDSGGSDKGTVNGEVGGCACIMAPGTPHKAWFPAALLLVLPWIRRRRAN